MNDAVRSLLQELERFGRENDARATERREKMLNITPETGELLSLLVRATKARRVLEIGTSNGYSTLWLADAVQPLAGSVVTVEVAAAKVALAQKNFERAGLSRWIRQEVTEAGEFLRGQRSSSVDLLFLDSDREHYVTWWPWIQEALAPGGLMVVDNAVSHASEMARFIEVVAATPGYTTVLVPIGNGELLVLKEGSATPARPATS
jgi:predicted O-methyltransferase YrrM